jgi:acyl-coenzyme A synthetase/AMP-(fatty) acid ligase/acyl carrier protein
MGDAMPSPSLPLLQTGEMASVGAHVGAIAKRFPGKAAIVQAGETLTYGALDAAANRLAHRLIAAGAKGDRVAHLLPDSASVFVALLAALKAGRVNHVLNHRDPPPRLEELVADSEPEAIVTAAPHVDLAVRLAAGRARVIRVDQPETDLPDTDPGVAIRPEDGAYLVYTSGSTGRPKAVLQPHAHIVRAALGVNELMALGPEDRIVLVASLWGGQATNTTWSTLFAGATLLPFPTVDYGVTGLEAWLNAERISIFISAASLFRRFLKTVGPATRFPGIRVVKVSSDAATWDDFRAFREHFPNGRLMSTMGASEVGNIACAMLDRDTPIGVGQLPVGKAFPGLDIRILAPDLTEVAPGETGLIAVGSAVLFDSYWRDPELTERHYYTRADGIRMFRSEDLGRVDESGNIFHAGRRDATHKIRGQRVDIAEVERMLGTLPGIEDAAAVVVPGAAGDMQLVGYLVPRGGSLPGARRLRAVARGFMPRHMVPSIFAAVPALPRTANGKVDRGRLRAMVPARRTTDAVPPATETERLLAAFWEEAFDIDGVGRDDEFFDLGGDSLIAAVISTRVDAALGLQMPFQAYVERPVLKDLAEAIDRGSLEFSAREAPGPEPRDGPVPLSLLQEPYWRVSRTPTHSQHYTRVGAVRFRGRLDLDAFRAALDAVVARHEILRTRYVLSGEAPMQVIEQAGPVDLPLIDLGGNPTGEEEVRRIAAHEARRVLDLTEKPPLSFALVRLDADTHVLLRTSHHILTDAPSWNIFLRDLAAFYEARLAGRVPELPALPVQYADFSIWQRRLWQPGGSRFEEAVAWFGRKLATEPPPRDQRFVRQYLRKTRLVPGEGRFALAWNTEAATSEALDALARAESSTFYIVRLACLAPVVSRLVGHETVMIGGVFTNRNGAAVEPMFGPLANYLPLVIRCDPSRTFREHLRHVRREVIEAHDYADMPLAEVTRALSEQGLSVPATAIWIHVPTPTPPVTFGGLEALSERLVSMPLGSGIILVRFNPLADDDATRISTNPEIYRPELLDDVAAMLKAFTARAAAAPDALLRDLMGSGDAGLPASPQARAETA